MTFFSMRFIFSYIFFGITIRQNWSLRTVGVDEEPIVPIESGSVIRFGEVGSDIWWDLGAQSFGDIIEDDRVVYKKHKVVGLVEELSWDGRVVRVDHDDRYAHSRGGLYERVEAADPRHFPHEMLRFVDDAGFDAATQSYLVNAPVEQTFAIPPVSEVLRGGAGGPEVLRGVLQVVLPTTDTLGDAVVPVVGDRLRVGAKLYQIVGVVPLNIGTGTAGYQCEVRT